MAAVQGLQQQGAGEPAGTFLQGPRGELHPLPQVCIVNSKFQLNKRPDWFHTGMTTYR